MTVTEVFVYALHTITGVSYATHCDPNGQGKRNNKHIRGILKLSKHKAKIIKRILVNLHECIKTKNTHTDDPFFHKEKGKEAVILEGSIEECTITDLLEDNMGYRNTTIMVNAHRIDKELGIVGRNAGMNAAKRMAAQY